MSDVLAYFTLVYLRGMARVMSPGAGLPGKEETDLLSYLPLAIAGVAGLWFVGILVSLSSGVERAQRRERN